MIIVEESISHFNTGSKAVCSGFNLRFNVLMIGNDQSRRGHVPGTTDRRVSLKPCYRTVTVMGKQRRKMSITWGCHVHQSAGWHHPSIASGHGPCWRSGTSLLCPAGGPCVPDQHPEDPPKQKSQHAHSSECHQLSPQHKPSGGVLHHPAPGSPKSSKARYRGRLASLCMRLSHLKSSYEPTHLSTQGLNVIFKRVVLPV